MDKLVTLLRVSIFRRLISILVYTILLSVFFTGGVLHLFIANNLDKTVYESNQYIEKADTLADDVNGIMDTLQEGDPQVCDDALLKKMRAVQFRSEYAKDIGFSKDNKLICTTGLGMLEKPFDEEPPQFTTKRGYSMWLNVPVKLFDFQRMGTVLKHGNFNVLINTDGFFKGVNPDFNTAVYLKLSEDNMLFQGGDKSVAPIQNTDYKDFGLSGFYSFQCSEKSIVCAMTYLPMYKAVQNNSSQILGIFMLSFISSTFITLYLNGYMNRLIMFKHRFLRNMTNENIICYYQPVIEVSTGKLAGCEVLVRWSDENNNIVTPDKFLDIVKEEKKTQELTNIITDNAFRDLEKVLNDMDKFKIAFNIFPVDFKQGDLRDMFDKYRQKFPKADINLELTEDELVEAPKISDDINRLRKAGYTVSIDDFGTGYSSLSYLQEIKVDFIKIDRSFVKDLELGTVKSQLIPLIASIAKTIDSDIIIEGIETAGQVEYIKGLGIEYVQGYFYSRPLPAAEFIAYVAKNA
jgi:sensor c-di-GMP phosphodiesterase-like protein